MKNHRNLNKLEQNPQAALNNSTNSIKHYRKRFIPSRPDTSSIYHNKRLQTAQHFIEEKHQQNNSYLQQNKSYLVGIMEESLKIKAITRKMRIDASQLDEILRKTSLKIELGVITSKSEIEEELLRLCQQLERKQLCNFKLN